MSEVHHLYEKVAAEFDRQRGRSLFERSYLLEVASRLKPGAEILDLGCGGGEPIARFFIELGFRLTGVDAAPSLLALCRERFPDMTWIEHDMRTLHLGRRFDAILAWNSFFHLRKDDQRTMFAVFENHAAPSGLLLFTSGPEESEANGSLCGHDLYHASLDPEEYRQLLERHGFDVLIHRSEDPDCSGHTVWLARMRPGDEAFGR
jgi:cyclopropane fatty-acyl-phospholipid synthase-like methyltransferase